MTASYDYSPGDRVRVTFETTVGFDGRIALGNRNYWGRDLSGATVDLIKPADGPSKDQIGTVRAGVSKDHAWVKANDNKWIVVGHSSSGKVFTDELVTAREVIGYIPNTPAAEAEQDRPLWTGDGSEEPPEYVKTVRDADGWEAERVGTGWSYTADSSGYRFTLPLSPWQWSDETGSQGPYTEVR